jgi:fructokinase
MRRRVPLVVGLGEALFDCFEDHEEIGGAPVNVAVHCHALLRGLGGRAVVASAVGNDKLGNQFLSLLDDWSIDRRLLKIDPIRPTGRVDVLIDTAGEPTYQFEANVAWDYLDFSESWELLASDCNAVCFGTLAQRSTMSRETIRKFLQVAKGAIRLFDVNLRQDFYSGDVIRRSLELASAAKLNLDELPIVCRLLGFAESAPAEVDLVASALIDQFELDWLALTRGPRGTAVYVGDEKFEAEVPSYQPHVKADGVGAGDACGAGLLVGELLRWPVAQRVTLANALGAFVASRPGAIPELPQQLIDSVQKASSSFVARH